MATNTVSEAIQSLRHSAEPATRAIGDAIEKYLDTGDDTASRLLQPVERVHALKDLVKACFDSNDADAAKVLEFTAICMRSGDAAFPVVRSNYDFPSKPSQSSCEDYAANFLELLLSMYEGDVEGFNRRFLDAVDSTGLEPVRLAAYLLSIGRGKLKFGWSTFEPSDSYLGCGLNIAYSNKVAPNSDESWSELDRRIWELDVDQTLELLRQQVNGPKGRWALHCRGFGMYHGALAALRPSILRTFLESSSDEDEATLDWFHIVKATSDFDKSAVDYVLRCKPSDGPRILILIDSIRPGTCSKEALEMVFLDDEIPDESGLCYIKDHHPDRLTEYLGAMVAKGESLLNITRETIRRSFRALAADAWETGGAKVALSVAASKLVPASIYTEGKASFQGFAFEGLLDSGADIPIADLREFLARSEKAVSQSDLKPKDKREATRFFYGVFVERFVEPFEEELWARAQDRYKVMRDLAISGLIKFPAKRVLPRAIELLDSRNADVRMTASELLGAMADDGAADALRTSLEKESSDKVRTALHEALAACGLDPVGGSSGDERTLQEIEENIRSQSKGVKLPKASWLDLDSLPALVAKGGSILSQDVTVLAIAKQSKHKSTAAAPDLAGLIDALDESKNADFALYLVEGFLDSDQLAADRWALTLGGLLGDHRIIPPLLSRIQGWCENSRHKLAEYAAQAISLLPGDEPLMVLDSLATRYRSKFKNVGRACAAAFEAAATARGITPDELGDTVVPSFEFDEDGIRKFEWEGGEISAELSPEFKLDPIRKAADRPKTRRSLRMNHSLKIK